MDKIKKIKPIGVYIQVKQDDAVDNTRDSGFIVQTNDIKRYNTGTVIALGKGVKLPNGQKTFFNVKPGDRIIYKDFSGYNLKDQTDQEYIMLLESDILATIE